MPGEAPPPGALPRPSRRDRLAPCMGSWQMTTPERLAFQVYRQSGLKLNLGLVVCLVGVAAGVAGMLDHSGNKDAFGIGVFLVVSFGALGALYLKQLISPAELHLTPAGLEARLVLRRDFWTWSEIRN